MRKQYFVAINLLGGWGSIQMTEWVKASIGDKMSWDTSPKSGLFYVLWISKGANIVFLPHPLRAMLCPCSSYQKKTKNTPTLNGGDRGGARILLFSEVTLCLNNFVADCLNLKSGRTSFRKLIEFIFFYAGM